MKHGTVTYANCTETGSVYVSVTVARTQVTYEKVPVVQSFGGDVQSIEEGVQVVIDKCDDGMWVVVGVLGRDADRLPKVEDQERVMSFDDGTEFSVRKDGNGNYDVSITASGSVSAESDGDVTATSQGNVNVDSAGDVSTSSTGDTNIDAGANVTISADGYVNLDAAGDVAIQSQQEVHIGPSNATGILAGTDVEVQGTSRGLLVTNIDGDKYRITVDSSGNVTTDGPL